MTEEVSGWLQVAVQVLAVIGIAWRFVSRIEAQSQLIAMEIHMLSKSVAELHTEVKTLHHTATTLDKRLAVIEDRNLRLVEYVEK